MRCHGRVEHRDVMISIHAQRTGAMKPLFNLRLEDWVGWNGSAQALRDMKIRFDHCAAATERISVVS